MEYVVDWAIYYFKNYFERSYAKKLKDEAPSVELLGGFVRDVYFGVEPKDIDLFIHCEDQDAFEKLSKITIDSLQDLFSLPSMKLYDFDYSCFINYSCDNPSSEFEERHYAVIKLTHIIPNLPDIDLIFTKSKDWIESLEGFDSNINMARMDDNKEIYWPFGIPTELIFYKTDTLSLERVNCMKAKWSQITEYKGRQSNVDLEEDGDSTSIINTQSYIVDADTSFKNYLEDNNRPTGDTACSVEYQDDEISKQIYEATKIMSSYIKLNYDLIPNANKIVDVYIRHPDNIKIEILESLNSKGEVEHKIKAKISFMSPDKFVKKYPKSVDAMCLGTL